MPSVPERTLHKRAVRARAMRAREMRLFVRSVLGVVGIRAWTMVRNAVHRPHATAHVPRHHVQRWFRACFCESSSSIDVREYRYVYCARNAICHVRKCTSVPSKCSALSSVALFANFFLFWKEYGKQGQAATTTLETTLILFERASPGPSNTSFTLCTSRCTP